MEKRGKGRPRKKEDSIEFWQFVRAAIATSAYDEARKEGDKHSVAVRQAVDAVRLRHPEMPISETGVRRILSAVRPRGSGAILCFERLILSEEDKKKHQWIREQTALLKVRKGTTSELPIYDETRPAAKYTIRFSERPNYPRHNHKDSNE